MIGRLIGRTAGNQAEILAKDWLVKHGMEYLTSNWRCRQGEIDLIMRDGETLVFIEVRYRSQSQYGGSLASVTRQKQQRLMVAARHYLGRHPEAAGACRFDVLGMEPGSDGKIRYQWIQHAFLGD